MGQPNTLREATRAAWRAAEVGDLEALETALVARGAALTQATPLEREAALGDGDVIRGLLARTRRQMEDQYRRLEQIKSGLNRIEAPRAATFDLRA